jgi:uncharacterized protein
MAVGEVVGFVARMWRFPVKSMSGEQLPEVEVTERGVLGDSLCAHRHGHGEGREREECEAVSRPAELQSKVR